MSTIRNKKHSLLVKQYNAAREKFHIINDDLKHTKLRIIRLNRDTFNPITSVLQRKIKRLESERKTYICKFKELKIKIKNSQIDYEFYGS